MSSSLIKALPFALLTLAGVAAQAAVPSHLYQLNGSLSDSLGGPSLTSHGGTLGATAYSFGGNQGLSVDSAVNADTYTIDISFSFDSTSSYRRIMDFKAGTSDSGLYNLNTALNFYPVTTGIGGAFASGQQVRLTVSRDAAGTFTGYVNGVQHISFNDTSGLATFSAANQTARFFIDDGGEASAGSVDYIAIYSSALSAQEIATLAPAVPEPETYALMLAGLAGVLAMARRRKQA